MATDTDIKPLNKDREDAALHPFVPGEHYRNRAPVGNVVFEHTHWFSARDRKLTSMLQVDLFVSGGAPGASSRASFTCLDARPVELRDLAEAMLAAAAELEAHLDQVTKMEGGAK